MSSHAMQVASDATDVFAQEFRVTLTLACKSSCLTDYCMYKSYTHSCTPTALQRKCTVLCTVDNGQVRSRPDKRHKSLRSS